MNQRALPRWVFIVVTAAAVLWMIPVVWMLSLSLQPNELLSRTTANTFLGLVPVPFTLDNFRAILSIGDTPRWFMNSMIVAGTSTFLVLATSTLAGYAFARIRFTGRSIVYPLVLAGLMVPEQVVFIPLYVMFADWNAHNSLPTLALPRVALPIGVFLMTQFFKDIPDSLEEAARLEGCGHARIFWSIMLPLATPMLMTLTIITFLYSWNDYLWPLVSAQRTDFFTITVGLAKIQGNFAQSQGLGQLMASGVLASLPVIILFLMFQKYILRGIALSTDK